MKNLSLTFFFFLSILVSFDSISKEDTVSNSLDDSITEKFVDTFGSDLTKESKDIKLKYKAGKGLEFKGGDAFKLKIGGRMQLSLIHI